MTIFHEPITLDKKVSGKNLGGVLIVTQTCLFPKIHPWKLVLANFYLQGIRFIHVDYWNLICEVPSFRFLQPQKEWVFKQNEVINASFYNFRWKYIILYIKITFNVAFSFVFEPSEVLWSVWEVPNMTTDISNFTRWIWFRRTKKNS